MELEDLLQKPFENLRAGFVDRFPAIDRVLAGKEPAIIFPAARMARSAARKLQRDGIQILAFGDSNPDLWGTTLDGLPVLSPDDIGRIHPNTAILLASTLHDSVMAEMLSEKGCHIIVSVGYLNLRLPGTFVSREYCGAFDSVANKSNHAAIRQAYGLLADEESRRVFMAKLEYYVSFDKSLLDGIKSNAPPYFDASALTLEKEEIVVDGGAFVGDTLTSFLRISGGRFKFYYAFEPDPASFAKLERLAAGNQNRIHAIRAGLSRETGQLRFLNTSAVDARILKDNEPGGETLPVIGLDDFFVDRSPPTLVKMDIEGAETDAIEGAAKMLAQSAPKLAVSIYHYPTDLWTIPLLIKRLNPAYRLLVRHYTREIDDTVCYAIPAIG